MRRLSQMTCCARFPLIVISTDATESRMERMFSLGARGYITKPFRPEALREELEGIWRGPLH